MRLQTLIAAIDIEGGIGKDNRLPWHYPADLKLFKELTVGHTVVMGHKTFKGLWEQHQKILPDRQTIVLTKNPYEQNLRYGELYYPTSLRFTANLDSVKELANSYTTIYYCGGAQLYQQVFDKIDTMYLSRIPADYKCDAFFPGTPSTNDGDLYEPYIPPHLTLSSSELVSKNEQTFKLDIYKSALS